MRPRLLVLDIIPNASSGRVFTLNAECYEYTAMTFDQTTEPEQETLDIPCEVIDPKQLT